MQHQKKTKKNNKTKTTTTLIKGKAIRKITVGAGFGLSGSTCQLTYLLYKTYSVPTCVKYFGDSPGKYV